MILAIEGADNSGKTTLAARLAKELSAIFIKSWLRPGHYRDLVSYTGMLAKAECLSPLVITDRHMAVSELVYGPILRGSSVFHHADVTGHVEGVHIIYCRAPRVTVVGTLFEREQLSGVVENFDAIITAYELDVIPKLTFASRPMIYDWTHGGGYDKILNEVNKRRAA